MVQRVQALAVVNAPEQLFIAVGLPDKIQAGLIQRDGVCGSQNADIVDVRLRRVAVAVTVDGDAVHHVDEDHLIAQIIADALGRLCHALQKLELQRHEAKKKLAELAKKQLEQTRIQNAALEEEKKERDKQAKYRTADNELGRLRYAEDKIANRQALIDSEKKTLEGICIRLHKARVGASGDFAAAVLKDLKSLELERAVFKVEISDAPLSATGKDSVRFMFNASGGTPVEVARCASGGELSRLMLCLKAMMGRFMNMPTLIFDEIDSGVSGSAADKMGRMICSMGKDMQVFAITHLPQVAAKGDAHYLVEKDFDGESATTSIRPITGEDRVMELARMLSGSRVSAAAIENAKSLLLG